jgi:FkbH-like protein
MPLDDRVIAISATFTAEAIQPGLAFWAGELGLDYEIRFAGYNQLFQQLLDPAGLFGRNRGGFNIALVRLDDWAQAGVDEPARRLVDSIRSASAAFQSPLILIICPSDPRFDAAAASIAAQLSAIPSVHVILPADVAALYPVSEIHDPHADQLGHLPYTPLFFAALATMLARRIHAIAHPPFKMIALDCDDTLWAGICGEDGPQGIEIDAPRRSLQQFMARRRSEGMLLALCSKNNEEDVLQTFAAHPEMPLRLEDFAAARINWDSKGVNLASLAAELSLGLDTFILVDDNPKECTEAQAGTPEVLALTLPAEPAAIPEFLRHVWAFDRPRVTAEDARRSAMYAQQAARNRAERSAGSLQEFLASLQLEVSIAPVESRQLPRVAQLTQRTNQMNASGIRRTEAEIRDLEAYAVSVQDRFGDYGLTGVIIVRAQADALVADTFLLSCRALGRGVEHRMVAKLGEIAKQRGLARVEIPFVAARRNRPALLFLDSIARETGYVFHLTADEAAALEYRPSENAVPPSPASHESADPSASVRHIDYARIAAELRTPEQVLESISVAARNSVPARPVATPPRTPLERELAELWAALLNVPAVGVNDNFFELGGHSLLAVQLLSRVRQIHGVELSLEVVYSGEFTVAELAKAVELKEIEQAGGDYQELLQELEGLSDEEVKALLAEEQDANPSHL